MPSPPPRREAQCHKSPWTGSNQRYQHPQRAASAREAKCSPVRTTPTWVILSLGGRNRELGAAATWSRSLVSPAAGPGRPPICRVCCGDGLERKVWPPRGFARCLQRSEALTPCAPPGSGGRHAGTACTPPRGCPTPDRWRQRTPGGGAAEWLHQSPGTTQAPVGAAQTWVARGAFTLVSASSSDCEKGLYSL